MSKNGGKYGRTEKSVGTQFRIARIPSEGSLEETTEEISIPDYVIRDFGQFEEPANERSSRRRKPEARDAGRLAG